MPFGARSASEKLSNLVEEQTRFGQLTDDRSDVRAAGRATRFSRSEPDSVSAEPDSCLSARAALPRNSRTWLKSKPGSGWSPMTEVMCARQVARHGSLGVNLIRCQPNQIHAFRRAQRFRETLEPG